MSELSVRAVRVDAIYPHPNADRLDIVKFGNYQTCEAKGKYKLGDIVAHFPPDILIPSTFGEGAGVANYLKTALYPGDTTKSKCRVGAVRLRGVPSFGFIVHACANPGEDLNESYGAVKYEPPEPQWFLQGCPAKQHPYFLEYTDIQNFRNSKYSGAIPIGTEVRITEKVHGTNSRVALIGEFMCGSHHCAMQQLDKHGRPSIYWNPLTENMQSMLRCISMEEGENVIAYGEIYGSKVQFMDYGIFGADGYALFDISVGGHYLDWEDVVYYTTRFCVPLVPLLFSGPFSTEIVDQLVDGLTIIGDTVKVRSEFKGREGVVITPLVEQYSPLLGDRMILKAVSVDYLSRRKTDSH